MYFQKHFHLYRCSPIFVAIAGCLSATSCLGVEVEGYTEPNRSINVAAHDQGVVNSVLVQVGDFVEAGQPIAQLDDTIYRILLDSAEERKSAKGRLKSAEAELRLKTTRLQKLEELRDSGFGRKEEVERARTDLEVATAELQAVQEDLAEKFIQHQKTEADLRRRVVHSPISGYVAERLKEPGEFVAPNEPNVVTIVELDPLLAKFSMRRSLARHLKIGQAVTITLDGYGHQVVGIVEQISPVVDAQSGTIKVKVRLDNSDGRLLSGERCMIEIPIQDHDSESEGSHLGTASRRPESVTDEPLTTSR